jgi:hypothetical protein
LPYLLFPLISGLTNAYENQSRVSAANVCASLFESQPIELVDAMSEYDACDMSAITPMRLVETLPISTAKERIDEDDLIVNYCGRVNQSSVRSSTGNPHSMSGSFLSSGLGARASCAPGIGGTIPPWPSPTTPAPSLAAAVPGTG